MIITDKLSYLKLLSEKYPTVGAVSSEIVNLRAILNLPKGTEHFMSDLHGEYEAFLHILANGSGVIREKVDDIFGRRLPAKARAELATLIYYPKEKLAERQSECSPEEMQEWYFITLHQLLEICRLVSAKYTRSKVRKALPTEFSYIIDELLHTDLRVEEKREYFESILNSIIDIGRAEDFIISICRSIHRLTVDHLHIVGDIFDRGPRADIIVDSLIRHHSVDVQWGNHDILWMGAAAGSLACIANVLTNSITYNNFDVLEIGYGISLRPLAIFANEVYGKNDTSCFKIKVVQDDADVTPQDVALASRMHKAIAVIAFKLEGQIIKRRPEFQMENRMMLHQADWEKGVITIDGVEHSLLDKDLPTMNVEQPYELSPEEALVMKQLQTAFTRSEKLRCHVQFLYAKGSIYKAYNGNLLYHGCIPMNEDGSFMSFTMGGKTLSGKGFMDYADMIARQGYYGESGSAERQFGQDFLWYLWCGRNSPLFGRDRITTFERRFIEDKSTWKEEKNPYYRLYERRDICEKILEEFGLHGTHCHIVNGHVPVKTKDGELPTKAGGRLVVIDGGFCKAYQSTTGIAGYTMIYNSWGIRLAAHEPFSGRDNAIARNSDIFSSTTVFDRMENRIKIMETDIGAQLLRRIENLTELLTAYRNGDIKESVKSEGMPPWS